jgi:hypothetical protein
VLVHHAIGSTTSSRPASGPRPPSGDATVTTCARSISVQEDVDHARGGIHDTRAFKGAAGYRMK